MSFHLCITMSVVSFMLKIGANSNNAFDLLDFFFLTLVLLSDPNVDISWPTNSMAQLTARRDIKEGGAIYLFMII